MDARQAQSMWGFVAPLLATVLPLGCDCSGYQQHESCASGGCPPADCESDPLSVGCPCDVAEPVDCYDGAPGTEGVGLCHLGVRGCYDGAWGPCLGQATPSTEICDEADND